MAVFNRDKEASQAGGFGGVGDWRIGLLTLQLLSGAELMSFEEKIAEIMTERGLTVAVAETTAGGW